MRQRRAPSPAARPNRTASMPAQPLLRRRRSNSAGDRMGMLKAWDDGNWRARETFLQKGLAVAGAGKGNKGARVFVDIRSSSMVVVGVVFALVTILSTIASSIYFESSWQKEMLVYPYISETARDMPQTGFFGFGMTVTCMVMVGCAVLQYGKVKRDLGVTQAEQGPWPVGTRRNLTSLITGIIAPPFLGLLACYDTARALQTHRVCVAIFFTLTMVYMFTTLSIYAYLASDAYREAVDAVTAARSGDSDGSGGRPGTPRLFKPAPESPSSKARRQKYEPNVRFSLRIKLAIAASFVVLTLVYLPIGIWLCKRPFGQGYTEPADVWVHAMRAMCQHLAVMCIILYYGTFYYDFGDLNLYLVNA